MKIIPFSTLGPVPEADFMPDSALLLPGRPMFYPEEGEGWQLQPLVAVHVNRLGKGIAPKFATRYYDGITVALRLTLSGHPSPGLLSGLDSSVVCGEWMAPDTVPAIIEADINGAPVTLTASPDDIAAALEAVSRLTIMKMGDIILLPPACPPLTATPRTHVEVRLTDGRMPLNLKIV